MIIRYNEMYNNRFIFVLLKYFFVSRFDGEDLQMRERVEAQRKQTKQWLEEQQELNRIKRLREKKNEK